MFRLPLLNPSHTDYWIQEIKYAYITELEILTCLNSLAVTFFFNTASNW
jgi:hypothetical protein